MISKTRAACLLLLLLFISIKIFGQRSTPHLLFLKNRIVSLPDSLPGEIIPQQGRLQESSKVKLLIIIQFRDIPDTALQEKLRLSGIELLEYVPDNAYTAIVTGRINPDVLKWAGVRAVYKPTVEDIVEPALLSGMVPGHARKVVGKMDLTLSFAKSFAIEEVLSQLLQSGFEVISAELKSYQILEVRIPENSIRKLAGFPWVQYIAPVPPAGEMLNDRSAASTRANVLASPAILGYKLTGEGVVIGLGDDSNPMVHPDIGKRVISYSGAGNSSHGVHVGGTAAGSGLLNEKYKGYAPKSKIVFRSRSQIWSNAPQLVSDYGMVVTSNTYPSVGGCGGFGSYSSYSYAIDQQAFDSPSLLHVFAAGNSGLQGGCYGLPIGFGNVLGDEQSAKNVLTVGNTQTNGIINTSSSKGPVMDGRIKPEVSAPGTSIVSTIPVNTYQAGSGTSFATPAVTGGAALLYERYRQLHQQVNPKNALIKALICNGATDQGLSGPDYTHGFGQMNLLRSVTMLDKNHYFSGEVAHQDERIHEIIVPPNTARLKVMIYWNDPSPSAFTGGKALVNNLDLSVVGPGNTKILPKFPTAASPTAEAVAGVDSVNNIEQVVLESPVAGNYAVHVEATKIPMGVQEYFVVYDIIESSLIVTYPLAGEHLAKGDAVNINWESYGDTLSTFNVAYSLDNGAAWITLDASVAAKQRQLSWTVPDASTGNAKVRVMRNGTAFTNTSGAFAILGIPVATLQSVQCEGYIALQWNAVSGATDYEVMLSTGDEMRSVLITNALKYTLSGLSTDSTYYVSVRARKNQIPGRRSLAQIRKPDSGNCQGTISDNDLKMEAVIAPLPTVREFTKVAYSAEESITIRIKNLDDQPTSRPFELGYSLGAEMHWESVNTTLGPAASMDYTFQRRVDLASITAATLLVRVRLLGDAVQINDSLVVKLRKIPNPQIVLPFIDDVESIPILDVRSNVLGIRGAEAYDFAKVEGKGNGRLRTRITPSVGYLSQNAFVMDVADPDGMNGARSSLTRTFNLSGFHVQNDDLRLNFRHTPSGYENIYIRGSSSDAWILLSWWEIPYIEPDNGFRLAPIELSQRLRSNSQEFSAEFQVKWEALAFKSFPDEGYAIDDIRLFRTTSDMELVRLNASPMSRCDSPVPFTAVFKNNGSDDCFNVPVKMSLDSTIWERTIDVIRKGDSATIVSYYSGEIYQPGKHLLKVWSEKGGDINQTNDTMQVELFTPGFIHAGSSYLENFESGSGSWFTWGGKNASWQYGAPSSSGVAQAASGSNAWKTNLAGFYNNNEESYLYSPCLYVDYMSSPFLSFSARMDMQQCGDDFCDMFYVEFNSGYGWYRLGTKDVGTNWYNNEKDLLGFWSGQVASGWRVFTVPLPTTGNIQIRFVFRSNAAGNGEGVTIDDIHIYSMSYYDSYEGGTATSGIGADHLLANDWTYYSIQGKIVAAIHPKGQDIGNIQMKTYLNEGPLQMSNNQLALDRSFVIESDKTFETPVGVRLYVPEMSIQQLVTTMEQPDLSKPASAYDLSMTKYSGQNQDGLLGNNSTIGWDFLSRDKVVKIPFARGYFLQFEAKSFSEFWLAKDYLGTGTPLPVSLVSFSVGKTAEGAAADLKWSTAAETDFSHFVVQVAVGAENVRKGLFYDLGTIEGQGGNGNSQYSFTDVQITSSGTRYYRLKMVDTDGSFAYSSIQSVAFDEVAEWRVFPNPSKGIFRLEPKGKVTGPITIEVIDLNGNLCKKTEFKATLPVLETDLKSPDLPEGPYVIKVISKEGEKRFKVVKE
jgi:hypothetical protein